MIEYIDLSVNLDTDPMHSPSFVWFFSFLLFHHLATFPSTGALSLHTVHAPFCCKASLSLDAFFLYKLGISHHDFDLGFLRICFCGPPYCTESSRMLTENTRQWYLPQTYLPKQNCLYEHHYLPLLCIFKFEFHCLRAVTVSRDVNSLGTYLKNAGEGNGTPLQYSCLANPMDGGAW